MNIGHAAKRSGLPAKTIRFYEDSGLIAPARRNENGYRDYSEADVHKLGFIQRARSLGFSLEDCRALLALYEDRSRASADVKRLALEHIAEIDAKLVALEDMRSTLIRLADACHGDDRPDCPILTSLAAPAADMREEAGA
jgi:Cu(I)-responsive transcriptional regulator